jgi:hypothetical protein
VMIAATDGERTRSKMLQIVRDKPGGRIISLIEDPLSGRATSVEGRMIEGIIAPPGTEET